MTGSQRPDYARAVRAGLTRPRQLLERLGVDLSGAQAQAGEGVLIRCPVHAERTPSCSVTRGGDGTIRVRCFGCDFAGDALHLIAAVRGLQLRGSFLEVLAEGAELGGQHQLADEIRAGGAVGDRPRAPLPPMPPPEPPREYPPEEQVAALWRESLPLSDSAPCAAYLRARKIDPVIAEGRQLARAIRGVDLPDWARYGARSWFETGHRMLVRAFDAGAALRSVRACRVTEGDSPKRLPPKGHRASGLVLANRAAWAMLAGREAPRRVLVAEGEPDWLTLATTQPEATAVLGITSGSWTEEIASRIPDAADVVVMTDPDQAGERYAAQVFESLGERCRTWRFAG